MGLTHGINIVKNGLILWNDFTSKRCYPGTGTTVTDLSPQNLSATTNGVTFQSSNISASFNFDGSADYISYGNNSNLDIGTSDFTIDAWFIDSTDGGGWEGIYTKGTSGVTGYGMQVSDTDHLVLSLQGSGGSNTHYGYGESSCELTHNVLYYGAVTADRDGLGKIYINNELKHSADISSNNGSANSTQVASIGSYSNSDFWYQGNIYCIRIYNRVLSPKEINQNYIAGKGRFGL